MSLFFVTTEDAADALVSATEYLTKVRVFVWPGGLVPATPSLWLMEWTTAYELRKLTMKWKRTPATGVPQDAAMCTFHFINLTGGLPDASWTTGDYTTVENAADTFWNALKVLHLAQTELTEYHWRADGPAFRPFGSSLSPTLRITPKAVAGSAASGTQLPPQCAITVTETTASTFVVEDVEGVGAQTRNRWGRYYLPAPTHGGCSNGRVEPGYQTTIANAAEAFYEACVTGGIHPVVYSPTTGHAWSVLEIHVDDIFDVIRSRRYITPLTRAPRVITQPA